MAEAAKKKLTWESLGSDVPTGDPAVDQTLNVKPAQPSKSLGTKVYERFWGTDMHDPVQYPRLGSQLISGVAGGYAGAEVGAAGGAALGSVIPGVGTAVGAGIGAGVGGVVGGLTGTAAGTVAPEAYMQTAEFLGLVKPGFAKEHGLKGGVFGRNMKTMLESEMLIDMITGGGLVGARLAVRGTGRLATGISGVLGFNKGARRLADKAALEGINLLPVQVGERTLPRGFVAVMGKFPLVSAPMRSRIHNTEKEWKAAFDSLPASIAPLALNMGSVSKQVMIDGKNIFKKFSDDMSKEYENVFARADASGAHITPQSTFDKTQEVLDMIKRETPAAAGKRKATHTGPMEEVKTFLNTDIATMFRTTKSGANTLADQSLKQMDILMQKVDGKIASLAKNAEPGSHEAIMELEGLKNSIKLDLYTNIHGPFANSIVMDLRGLDIAYSKKMTDVFETVAAKRFGTVKRGGLKQFNFDSNTRTSTESLADILIRGDTIQEITDLKQLVEPGTFKEIAANVLQKRVEDAYVPGEKGMQLLDIDKLSKNLGLDKPGSKRYLHTEKMLELSGGVDMKRLKSLLEVGQKVASVEAPNSSIFMARRVTMGGLQAIVGGLLPVMGAHGAGQGVAGVAGGFIGSAIVIGGAHLFSRMISDPSIARSLIYVMKPETKRIARQAAWMKGVQTAIHAGVTAGQWTEDEAMNIYGNMKTAADLIMKEDIRQNGPDRGPGEVPSSE